MRRYLRIRRRSSYTSGGFEALKPQGKNNNSNYKIPENIVQEAILLRREQPNRSIPTIIQILELEGKVEPGFLKRTTLQDALARAGYSASMMKMYQNDGYASQRFQRLHRHDLWQGDITRLAADAIVNARLNGIRNCWFTAGDAGAFMLNCDTAPDVVFMDPPRSGSDRKFLDALMKARPKRIVYISCDPETMARDLRMLTSGEYRARKIQPVDMFPYTEHVETVVLLSQQKPKDQIVVDLDLSELDLTSAEAKATYKEIQDYVLKKYGLKVSNLYVSQIKRKCGLEMGQNYNLSKSDNARVPICPPEKEAAIMDALRHFKMI